MKNQSSLNDIFRFVQLRGGNILKSYPVKVTDTIQAAKNKTTEEKIELANTYLSNLNFTIKKLGLGTEVRAALNNYSNNTKSTVGQFYNSVFQMLTSNYNNLEEDFEKDLNMLSELVYFSNYSSYEKLSDTNLQLYVMYQVLERARVNKLFQKFLLHNIRLLGLSKATEPFIKSVGVADLLVVKQHLLRYEETEIAHIENVMKGETRSREHRFLDRFEETLIYENEKSVETEKESETTERFEMNRETSKTIQEDQKFSTDLSVSGKYGPTTIAANMAYSLDTSETTETKSSSEYAKDIMDRSLEKVNERIRTERITKIIKENETKDLHSFTNVLIEGATNELEQISGIYQFVDKIYQAQVFNYGQRQMFDLMIPEPASYLRYLNNIGDNITNSSLIQPPKLDIHFYQIGYKLKQGYYQATGETFLFGDKNHYSNYVSLYEAQGVKSPPEAMTFSFSYSRPKENSEPDAILGEGATYMAPPKSFDIEIKDGYIPKKIKLSVIGYTDRHKGLKFDFLVGSSYFQMISGNGVENLRNTYTAEDKDHVAFSGKFNEPKNIELPDDFIANANNKLSIGYFARETNNHIIKGEIICEPSEVIIRDWQQETYDILQAAYQDRLMEYENKLAQYNADRKAQESFEKNNYGVPPSKQKQIMLTELKKHAISLFTDNLSFSPDDVSNDTTRFNTDFPIVVDDADEKPPKIDRVKAKKQGDFIRFFEQAFEWSQMQYALYPYFWSKQESWDKKFKLDDPNYEYQQFLQASAARLVLPVRLGFEAVVAHYMETGNVWGGEGVPSIEDPLYLSIVDEIREQSGNTEQEPIPVGKPWEVRLPTSLIKLKKEDGLPKWKENPVGSWVWEKDVTD